MKIKKGNFIKKSLLIESSVIDVLSKLSPMEMKILKAMVNRFSTTSGYTSDHEIIDELVDNWGMDFHTAIKLGKLYSNYKYYLSQTPSEGYSEINKSEVFKEYFSRFLLKYDEEQQNEESRLGGLLTFKYKVDDNECEGNLITDVWVYPGSILGYNNYFTFYSRPYDRYYNGNCYIGGTKSIMSACKFFGVNDKTIKLEYKMKHDKNFQNEIVNTYTEIIPIPQNLNKEITIDWFINTLYKESYQRALNSTVFEYDSGGN